MTDGLKKKSNEKKTVKKKVARNVKKSVKKKTSQKSSDKNSKEKSSEKARGEEEPKKNNGLKYLIIGLSVIVIIFVLLLLYPHFSRWEDTDLYNNFEFVQDVDGFWNAKMEINGQPYTIIFHHHPDELENITISENSTRAVSELAKFVKAKDEGSILVAMSPEAPAAVAMAYVELKKVLGSDFNIYNIPIQGAYTHKLNGLNESDVPLVTCATRPKNTLVFELKVTDKDKITYPQPGCIIIEGHNATEVIKGADRFVYSLLGIMST